MGAVSFGPPRTAPFWSTTLPMRPFMNVMFLPPGSPWFSNTAVDGVPPPASRLSPSKVTLDALLSSLRITLPGAPANVTRLEPPGTT